MSRRAPCAATARPRPGRGGAASLPRALVRMQRDRLGPPKGLSALRRVDPFDGIPGEIDQLYRELLTRDWVALGRRLDELTPGFSQADDQLAGSTVSHVVDGIVDVKRISPGRKELFIGFGGVAAISAIILTVADDRSAPASKAALRAMAALNELSSFSQAVSDELGHTAGLMPLLLRHLRREEHFYTALYLVEKIFFSSLVTYDITTMPDLCETMRRASPLEFSQSCRLLNLFVFDPEESQDCSDSMDRARAGLNVYISPQRSACTAALLANHKFTLESAVLGRLMQVANLPLRLVRRTLDHDMQLLLRQHPELMMLMLGPFDPESFKMMVEQVNLIEVFFVLSMLLAGPARMEAQEKVCGLGLVRSLAEYFPLLEWGTVPPVVHERDAPHGPGCQCNSENTFKVQYLRLLHNLFDSLPAGGQPSFLPQLRRLLLSPQQFEEWKECARECGTEIPALPAPDSSCKGLLTDVVDALMAEPLDSPFRNFLASCVESFLRASTAADRLFVVRRGLLHHVIGLLMSSWVGGAPSSSGGMDGARAGAGAGAASWGLGGAESGSHGGSGGGSSGGAGGCTGHGHGPSSSGDSAGKASGVGGAGLQTTANMQYLFDLLAELLRFCPPALAMLERQLDDVAFTRLISIASSHMVASNVFMRVILLTINSTDQPSRFRTHIHAPGVQAGLLHDLLFLITVDILAQENICCLNTCVLLFIFARRAGRMAQLLEELSHTPVLANLLRLLRFWTLYYVERDKDKTALQTSTRIAFGEWAETVAALLGPRDSEDTILHWLPEGA